MSTAPSRVIRFREYGEPLDVLVEERTEIPDPTAGRVRVRVVAAGLNPADWELCRGFMPGNLPRGIGYDVAGRVDALGPGVEDVVVGDLVVGAADFVGQPSAGAADVAILSSWTPVPEGLDPIAAAVLPMVVQTAVWTLSGMGVGSGTTLLVHGAGAMVGYGAVQVAIGLGARVIATAGPTYASDLEEFGAVVTSYGEGMAERVRELASGPVDLVLDAAPPTPGTVPVLLGVVRAPQDVVTISNHDEARRLGARVNLDLLTEAATPLVDPVPDFVVHASKGTFRLPVARTFPLGAWREAAKLSLSRAPHGKVVLLPGEDA
ncbi:alcohol dehydrogenase catalytic domain-containing protein [Pseudonocardia kujensis]|uniref:alcohol dehydrogenase catalytic domain-containing protein n=1 Tax=Pseudonocardia kujensis TaxID=1128675 RepID=UPI001E4997F1|nr:alcohol dehydrogenase catalytic domain-containing protein [Pseudonocardia kujensis]MCE0763305.1 alcohol dehydrogenase catalytic domain-containing protein [Pseudonocardia kujensis]